MKNKYLTDWQKWIDTNCLSTENKWCNGIEYIFGVMKDGWIAIFERERGRLTPLIQAADMPHALSWCNRRERVTVPLQELCPR